jgi:hypothetical protein
MEALLTNIELILVAGALVANFIISLSKKFPNLAPTNDKLDSIIEQVKLNRRDSLRALIYSQAPVLNKMYGLHEFIALGYNSDVLSWAIKDFILPNKEFWHSVVDSCKNDVIHDIARYKQSVEKINKALW